MERFVQKYRIWGVIKTTMRYHFTPVRMAAIQLGHSDDQNTLVVLSRVPFFATPWTVAYQAPPSLELSRQEYWIGLLFLTPGALPYPGIKPTSPVSPALPHGFYTTNAPWQVSFIFGPYAQFLTYSSPNPLNFLIVETDKAVSCYDNEVTFGPH